jgi:phenylalanyl-tRNA synthetase beta chain
MDSKGPPPYYHPGRAVRWGDVAVLGELHPEYAESKHQRIYIAELDVEMLLSSEVRHSVEPIPRFPWIRRDLSLLLDRGTRYEEVRATVASAGIPNLIRIEPFDRLESGPFPESKYSLAISLVYQSSERTLTDEEVEQFDRQILTLLVQRLGAQLRK